MSISSFKFGVVPDLYKILEGKMMMSLVHSLEEEYIRKAGSRLKVNCKSTLPAKSKI